MRDGEGVCEVTEDHSLFNSKKEKVKPSEIDENTELEYYTGEICGDRTENYSDERLKLILRFIEYGRLDRIPVTLLNSDDDTKKRFTAMVDMEKIQHPSKTLLAGLMYMRR